MTVRGGLIITTWLFPFSSGVLIAWLNVTSFVRLRPTSAKLPRAVFLADREAGVELGVARLRVQRVHVALQIGGRRVIGGAAGADDQGIADRHVELHEPRSLPFGRACQTHAGQIVRRRSASRRRIVEAGPAGIVIIFRVEIRARGAEADDRARPVARLDLDTLRGRLGGVAGDEGRAVVRRHLQIGEAGAEQRDIEVELAVEQAHFRAEFPCACAFVVKIETAVVVSDIVEQQPVVRQESLRPSSLSHS